jgi:hypothetical protein
MPGGIHVDPNASGAGAPLVIVGASVGCAV